MSPARSLLFVLVPLFAGCQVFKQPEPPVPLQRLQGELSAGSSGLLFRPCGEQRQFSISNDGTTDIVREAAELLADGPGPLFADISGQLGASTAKDVAGQLQLSEVYRIQREGPACNEAGFQRLLLRANGNEPDWSLSVTGKGLALFRPGQPALALPYLEEALPDGRFNLTSEANDQRLDLWVAPQRCTDSMSGTVQHLSAELRLDGQIYRGCASFGGARNR